MMTKDLTQYTLVKELIALPTPCNDVVYYPAKLATLEAEGTYSVFQALSHKSGLAYIVVTQPNTAKIILAGSKHSINELYKAIPWPNYEIEDGDNKFYYKESPSLQVLEDYFINLNEQ
ncbi:hypothetical protein F6Y04_05605 [Bacillus megaterium]|nr:hypothetical protein [Priestia megaterium]